MLIIGLTGVTLSIVSFGLSKSFWMLVVSRCVGGMLNGNVACVHLLAERSNDGLMSSRSQGDQVCRGRDHGRVESRSGLLLPPACMVHRLHHWVRCSTYPHLTSQY